MCEFDGQTDNVSAIHSVSQSISFSVNQPERQASSKQINQSVNHPATCSAPDSYSAGHLAPKARLHQRKEKSPRCWNMDQSEHNNQLVSEWVGRSVGLLVIQSVNDSIRQAVGRLVFHSFSLSISLSSSCLNLLVLPNRNPKNKQAGLWKSCILWNLSEWCEYFFFLLMGKNQPVLSVGSKR